MYPGYPEKHFFEWPPDFGNYAPLPGEMTNVSVIYILLCRLYK